MRAPVKLDPGAYPVNIYAVPDVVPEDKEELEKFLATVLDGEYDIDIDPSDAAATLAAEDVIVVLIAPMQDELERAVALCHESSHVVSFTWLRTKQKLSAKHDEPAAYLLAHVFRQLLEVQ